LEYYEIINWNTTRSLIGILRDHLLEYYEIINWNTTRSLIGILRDH